MRKLQWHGAIAGAALVAFCASAPLSAQTGSAQSPAAAAAAGATGATSASTPGAAGLPPTVDTSGAMNGGANGVAAQPNGTAPATAAPLDTNSAAGTYDQTSGNYARGHNWGWIGIFGLLGLFGLGGRRPSTIDRTERTVAEPDVVTRP